MWLRKETIIILEIEKTKIGAFEVFRFLKNPKTYVLADRTNGRAYDTVLRYLCHLSVVCTECICG